MTFGARVLKTGIAVTMALYISILLHAEPPIIAAVAAIFTIQPSIYKSWRYLLEQLQTNTLGGVLALIASIFFGAEPIAVGLVCILVIMICLKLKMEETVGVTLITVIAIMEAGGQWAFALNRFSLTMIGIFSAFLINIIFFPPKLKTQFYEGVREGFGKLSLLLRTVISNEIKETVYQESAADLTGSLEGLTGKYKLLEEEQKKLHAKTFGDVRELVVHKQILGTLQKGASALEAVGEHYFPTERSAEIDRLFDAYIEKLVKFHEHVLLKLEDKIKPNASTGERDSIEEAEDLFMQRAIEYAGDPSGAWLRLSVVAAALYDYGQHLRRTDKLVERYLQRNADGDGAGKEPETFS